MKFVCYNGKIINADEPVFTAQNRSFRYGDGLFETIKVVQNKILLADYHFDRLFAGLRLLQIDTEEGFTSGGLSTYILQLCLLNNCTNLARVRLAVYRDHTNKAEFVIEAFSLSADVMQLNETGLTVGLYPFVRKACDAFANLKTSNYLPYVMADKYATERGWNETLVLNSGNKICDASKANIFLIVKNEISTPALYEGCINGVTRRFIIERLKELGYIVNQTKVDEDMLLNANEVFLTNAVYGIRWVQQFRSKEYNCSRTVDIYKQVFKKLV